MPTVLLQFFYLFFDDFTDNEKKNVAEKNCIACASDQFNLCEHHTLLFSKIFSLEYVGLSKNKTHTRYESSFFSNEKIMCRYIHIYTSGKKKKRSKSMKL